MRKYTHANLAVSTVLALTFSVTAVAGGGARMGVGRGSAAAIPTPRPSQKDRLAELETLTKQIAILKSAIDKAPAEDPNIANLEGDALTKFMDQYTEESNLINQIAQIINSLRGVPTTSVRGGRRFGGTALSTDVLSELSVLAQDENATNTVARIDALLQEAQAGGAGGTEYIEDQTGRWRVHDMSRPAPPVITPGIESTQEQAGTAPSDAIVLFDGTDLSNWTSERGGEPGWIVRDGYTESVRDSGSIQTRQSFGSCQLHVEFATPTRITGTGQDRGNSGVYLMSTYEVQILDSYENSTYPDGQCAALYGRNVPLVNASWKPGEWQSFDIIFHRPIFEGNEVVRKATFTVFHNGVLVHDHVELQGGTEWMGPTMVTNYAPHADKLPIMLQDHDNPVRFRNIWIRELED